MTEILGMPVNAIVDEAIACFGMAIILLRLLRLKPKSKKLYRGLLYCYWLVEMPILYLRVYETTYSEFVVQSTRAFTMFGLIFICRLLTGEGGWKIFGAIILADLFSGIPGVLRMLTCMLFEIPLPGLKAEEFRWDLKCIYLFYMAVEYLIVRRWSEKYRESRGNFGILWKTVFLLYVVPPYLSVFSSFVTMKSDTALHYIGNAIVIPLEGVIVFFYADGAEQTAAPGKPISPPADLTVFGA